MSYNGEIAANLVDTSTWKKHSTLTLDMGDPAAIAFTNTNTWGGGSLIFGVGGTLPAGTYTLNLGIEYSEVAEQWSGTRVICSEKINGKCIVNGTYKDQMGTDSGYYFVASLPLTFTAENDFAIGIAMEKGSGTIVELKLEEGTAASAWQPFLDDVSGGGAVMSDDIITLGYNGRGGRICWTYDMLASHIGEACTLSFWARFGSDAAMLKYAAIYPYQENGIVVAKHAYGEGSNFQTVALTDEWQYFEYSGTVRQLQDTAGHSAGEMFIWCSENNGGPSIQLAGIMLTLAGGGCSDE